jgi:hypothetical protein
MFKGLTVKYQARASVIIHDELSFSNKINSDLIVICLQGASD